MWNSGLRVLLACGAAWLAACSGPSQPPPMTFDLGERVPCGHITYRVFDTQWATELGQGVDARVPQNRFFLVRMSIVNGGSSDANIPNFVIQDDHGKTYYELSNGDSVPKWIGYLRVLKPTDDLQGNIVFDAPPAHYKLRVADEDHSHQALVDIPLSFGSETPEVVTPGSGTNP